MKKDLGYYAIKRNICGWLADAIFNWADKKYGVKARGEVRLKSVYHPVLGAGGISDFDERQKKMLEKWHYWMRVKNRILK